MTDVTLEGPAASAFADPAQAQQAVEALKQAGYRDDQIGIVSKDSVEGHRPAADRNGEIRTRESRIKEGAAAGMAVGAGLAAMFGSVLWGASVLSGVIPGIGPIIAGGTLGVLLTTTVAGAAAASLGGTLQGIGLTEQDARFYEAELHAGRTIITVQGEGMDDAQEILTRHGGYDRMTNRA
ncbi:general stress protein [Planctomyces sp. SH-PL14]|uniref:general stress protein n=1 Tax=Planctomyces sp. SH-PL14 TaxID=1632864 RepID=UPI00078D79AB|nr:general stress protein [Planctomyces sp. SH-PL14]AMV20674.1 Heat induced stress protein YflT [Planctomyces sp. SH-PL14]